MSAFDNAVQSLESASLASIDAEASLQTRVDRKYVVDAAIVDNLIAQFDGSVLDIDGQRRFEYETTYYDTPALDLYLDTAYGRPKRFKVRVRRYVDSGLVMIEVKAKNGRGKTVKSRIEYRGEAAALSATVHTFVDSVIATDLTHCLAPSLVTSFMRTTLIDADRQSRYTIDHGLVATAPDQRDVSQSSVIVECKSAGATSSVDRWLWQHQVRPAKMSKYCTAIAVLNPLLPANRWHRTLQRHFGARTHNSTLRT